MTTQAEISKHLGLQPVGTIQAGRFNYGAHPAYTYWGNLDRTQFVSVGTTVLSEQFHPLTLSMTEFFQLRGEIEWFQREWELVKIETAKGEATTYVVSRNYSYVCDRENLSDVRRHELERSYRPNHKNLEKVKMLAERWLAAHQFDAKILLPNQAALLYRAAAK